MKDNLEEMNSTSRVSCNIYISKILIIVFERKCENALVPENSFYLSYNILILINFNISMRALVLWHWVITNILQGNLTLM